MLGQRADPRASEESHMSAGARDKEDTKSITTPISPAKNPLAFLCLSACSS